MAFLSAALDPSPHNRPSQLRRWAMICSYAPCRNTLLTKRGSPRPRPAPRISFSCPFSHPSLMLSSQSGGPVTAFDQGSNRSPYTASFIPEPYPSIGFFAGVFQRIGRPLSGPVDAHPDWEVSVCPGGLPIVLFMSLYSMLYENCRRADIAYNIL